MTPLTVTPADLDTLTRTLYGEARGEPVAGQYGVAWVVRNRVEWPDGPHWWGNTVADVCRRPWQFSCWDMSDANRPLLELLTPSAPLYIELYETARAVCAGEVPDPTGHASHYERLGTIANWGIGKTPSAIIGKHAFYSLGPKG